MLWRSHLFGGPPRAKPHTARPSVHGNDSAPRGRWVVVHVANT